MIGLMILAAFAVSFGAGLAIWRILECLDPRPRKSWRWTENLTQNGQISFTAVLPPASTGRSYLIRGDPHSD